MATALSDVGYEVVMTTDADLGGMHKEVSRFRKELHGREVGLFYYAGHGFNPRATTISFRLVEI